MQPVNRLHHSRRRRYLGIEPMRDGLLAGVAGCSAPVRRTDTSSGPAGNGGIPAGSDRGRTGAEWRAVANPRGTKCDARYANGC